mgnify:CR=1 FL=1
MKPEKQTDYPIHEFIKKRWSPRAFSEKAIPTNEILSLFEAARWAASARNLQPWYFIWANKDNPEMYRELSECLDPWNESWTRTADLLLIALVNTVSGSDKKYKNETALFDLGLAIGNMTTQASSSGIYLHNMGGIKPDLIREKFQLPAEIIPVVMIAGGYLGNVEQIPADIAASEYLEQERKGQEEFVFNDFPDWSKIKY